MSIKLSKTEIEVGKLYFEQGKKPKEIAETLGLSINTVYKAISKYRSYMREISRIISQNNDKDKNNILPENASNENGSTKIVKIDVKDTTKKSTISITFNMKMYYALSIPRYTKTEQIYTNHKEDSKLMYDMFIRILEKSEALIKILENIGNTLSRIAEYVKHSKINIESSESEKYSKSSDNVNEVPSFIRDNVWVDIIKSKFSH